MGFRHYAVGKPHGRSQMLVPSTASAVEGEASEASEGFPTDGSMGTWRLVVKDQDTGARVAGTTLSVEPTELSQVLMGLSGDEEPEDVGLPTLELIRLQAFETEDHVFLFGSVAHEPTANGTYFPVAAVVPKRAKGRDAAYASPRGCACEGGGGAPVGLAALVLGILGVRARRLRRA